MIASLVPHRWIRLGTILRARRYSTKMEEDEFGKFEKLNLKMILKPLASAHLREGGL
jgi:hypothetical protein